MDHRGQIVVETSRDPVHALVRVVVADDGPGIPAGRARQAVPAVLLDQAARLGARPGHRPADRRRARRQRRSDGQCAAGHAVHDRAALLSARHGFDPHRRRRARRAHRPRRRAARRGLRRRRRASRAKPASSGSSTQTYDVVLLDVWMPGIDGLETLQRLRERRVDAEVVVISGHGNVESAVRAIKLGAFDFIEKPLSLEKAVLVVRHALRQRAARSREPRPARPGRSPAHADRRQPGDAAPARAGAAGRADQRPGADPRRERHRQGSGGAHAARALAAPQRARSSRSTARRFPRS